MKSRAWERFQLVSRLGRGSFGETLLVRDQNEGGCLVVIKVPLDDQTERALIQELIHSAVLHASLREMYHPNIVRYRGFDKYRGHWVMVMEYVKGSDLRKIIGPAERVRRPMDVDRAVRLIRHVCAALVAAHSARLQHNDVKPENILVEEGSDLAKLTDFGVSQIRKSSSSTPFAAGTRFYMAPETWDGRSCFQSDLWSLGVTFYELVTGRLPFFATSDGELMRKIARDDPIPPGELNRQVDSRIQRVILRALEKHPRRRFSSAEEMLGALGHDVDQQIRRARELFEQGKAEDAEALLKKLLEFNPSEPKIYMALGALHNRQFQWSEGEQILRRGVEMCPQHAPLHFSLALALANRNRKEAAAMLERAMQLGLSEDQRERAERLLQAWRTRGF